MAMSGLKIGQVVFVNLHPWTVWSQAPQRGHWWLHRHDPGDGTPSGFLECSQSKMFRTLALEQSHLAEQQRKAERQAGARV